tara:strand:- start:56 stop:1030 length:975 start_codon:yes stop_codon:yes gene_type:complete
MNRALKNIFLKKTTSKYINNFLHFVVISALFIGSFVYPAEFLDAAQTTCNWTGGGDGASWEDKNNWDCGIIPNGAEYDVVMCDADHTATTTVSATTTGLTIGGLTLGENSGSSASCNGFWNILKLGTDITATDTDGAWAGNITVGAMGQIAMNGRDISVAGDITNSDANNRALGGIEFADNTTSTIRFTGTGTFSNGVGSWQRPVPSITAAEVGETTTLNIGTGGFLVGGQLHLKGGTFSSNKGPRFYETEAYPFIVEPGTTFSNYTGLFQYNIVAQTPISVNLASTTYPDSVLVQHNQDNLDHYLSGSTTIMGELTVQGNSGM